MTSGNSESGFFRVYEPGDCGKDGYPFVWHKLPSAHGTWPGLKDIVREQAGNRCVRCGHPYEKGKHGSGEWTPCDALCTHSGPFRYGRDVDFNGWYGPYEGETLQSGSVLTVGKWERVEAAWRILTVHHLNGTKADLRWWNLAALCQRCHLRIQRTVVMPRVFPWEHSEWFKPYAAGWYASAYLGEELSWEQTLARLDELLALERVA